LKCGLLFDDRSGLITAGHSPPTGGDLSGHSFPNWPYSPHTHTHIHSRTHTPLKWPTRVGYCIVTELCMGAIEIGVWTICLHTPSLCIHLPHCNNRFRDLTFHNCSGNITSFMNGLFRIVACRPVARQRLRNKQLYNSRC
jgi:putative component of membrane protein insertase Oxa1/YidC/SpoIIIJ protein YidD